MTMSTDAQARMRDARQPDGRFGNQLHADSGLTLKGPGARPSFMQALEGRFPDTPVCRDAAAEVDRILDAGMSEGETSAALYDVARRLRNSPDRQAEQLGSQMILNIFDLNPSGASAWDTGIQDTDAISFDAVEPRGHEQTAAMNRMASAMKLSGLKGRVTDIDLTEPEATYTDATGRQFIINMRDGFKVELGSYADGPGYRGLIPYSAEAYPASPQAIRDTVVKLAQGEAAAAAWKEHSGLKSGGDATFTDLSVLKDGFLESARFTAETGDGKYRIERILDRRTGDHETRVTSLYEEPRDGRIRTTTAIIDEITSAADTLLSRPMIEHRLGNVIDEALHDPSYRTDDAA